MTRPIKIASLLVYLLALCVLSACGLLLDDAARLERAREAYAAGDFSAAVVDLRALLQAKPDNVDARLLLGEALFRTGDLQAAKEEFQRGVELLREGPESGAEPRPNAESEIVETVGKLAAIQLTLGEFEPAFANAEFVLGSDPGNIAALLIASQSAYGLDDNAQSRAYAVQLMERSPGNPLGHAMLGFVDAREGAYVDAEAHFEAVLVQQPDHHAVRLTLTQLQIAMQKPEAAVATLVPMLVQVPTDTQLLKLVDVMQLGTPEARASVDAIAARIETSNPESPVPGVLRGRSLVLAREYGAAAEQFQSAMTKGGGWYAVVGYYVAQRAAGDQPGAQRALEQWVEGNPGDPAPGFMLAAAYLEQGQNDRARALYERLVGTADADSPLILNNLAWLYGEINDPRAIETARKAHELAPDNPAIADTLGWLLVKAGQREEGIQILRRAVQQAPGVDEIRYHLATALAEAGDTDAQRQIDAILRNSTLEPGAVAPPETPPSPQ